MPTYNCQRPGCNGKIYSSYELTVSPHLLCNKCNYEIVGDRNSTFQELIIKQHGKCVVAGCPYKVKSKSFGNGGFHVHRITKGRDGGRYVPENCVLVCPVHHRLIEGKSLQEILDMKCLPEHIEKMNIYNVADDLTDYPIDTIQNAISEMCTNLGVPAQCSKYDILEAIANVLYGAKVVL